MITEGGQVVRAWSKCRMVRTAAMTVPIRQGLMLTLRNARKVIFSRALARSPMARTRLCALLNCCWVVVRRPCLGF